jgi:DNA-binding transcriptional ArsR family regulator/precorrin-6B methylase 2
MQHVLEAATPATQRWELYRLLSEPIRLRILALAGEDELSIGELADVLGESQPNVSRHVATLGRAGLVALRRDGTRALVRLRDDGDLVVRDAIASGRSLCETDGSLKRLGDVLRARDSIARDYFDAANTERELGGTLGAYLAALAPLIPNRHLAVDAGTGDGSLLEVLSPIFERVIGIDRSEAQLAMARARIKHRGLPNVTLLRGELDAPEVLRVAGGKADVVFAVRLLHHASKPGVVLKKLAELVAPEGTVVVVDYASHDDERMREQADLWLGFAPEDLRKIARAAGLHDMHVTSIPSRLCGSGPDAHLPWQLFTAHPKRGKSHG